MNSVILIGRLTANPVLRMTASNKEVVRFTIAVNREYKNTNGEREADFINCLAFNKTAEVINNYLKKGDLTAISGAIRTSSYVNKNDKKVYVTEVVVDKITFLETKKQENNQKEKSNDPYADFGEQIPIDDNFLE